MKAGQVVGRIFFSCLFVVGTSPPIVTGNASAVPAPAVDPARVPADGPPGPDQPVRQSNVCTDAVAAPQSDLTEPAQGFTMLNVAAAWRFSTGKGVAVAVIDTGVSPNSRLHVTGGGDYITGGDGLSDCDAHGTIVASVIAAAPRLGTGASEFLDGIAGVAPDAGVISIRQSSRAYETQNYGPGDTEARRTAGTLQTLARAVVHAANLGAKVINVSVAACVPAADPIDQGAIGAAVWYAATVKDAVIVAAAGNVGEEGCAQNSAGGPTSASETRDWRTVKTISSPSWFVDHVLSVGALDSDGTPVAKSLAGPWVQVGAPGTAISGLSPRTGLPANSYPPPRIGQEYVPIWGTSFAAAYVSGLAALVRSKYPDLTAQQVIDRIIRTAHNPARGADNRIGYGVIDPVAALTFDIGQPPAGSKPNIRRVSPDQRAAPTDHRPRNYALALVGAFIAAAISSAIAATARKAR